MNKKINRWAVSLMLLGAFEAMASGRLQNEDSKSLAEIQAAVLTTTGNLTSGNACIVSPGSVSGLATGQFIYDTTTPAHVPGGTTIAGLPGTCSAGQIQMSANAGGSGTGDTLTFGGQASQLLNATKIWDTVNSKQLSTTLGLEWLLNGTNLYYSGGNVGLGTTAPSDTLQIVGGLTLGGGSITGAPGTIYQNTGGGFEIQTITGTTNDFSLRTPSNTELMAVPTGTTNVRFNVGDNIIGADGSSDAAAGNLGEYIESIVTNVSFPATSTYGDCTSISLTKGDWDVTFMIQMQASAITGTTWNGGVSSTTGNSTTGLGAANLLPSPTLATAASGVGITIPNYRVKVSTTTTYFGKFQAVYTVGSPSANCRLSARRAR